MTQLQSELSKEIAQGSAEHLKISECFPCFRQVLLVIHA